MKINKLNAFIKANKKYQNISVTIKKISKINKDDYIISYLPLLQEKKHIKFASTLTVTINTPKQSIEIAKDEEKLDEIVPLTDENIQDIVKKVDLPVSQEQQMSSASKDPNLPNFSLDYQEKFKALQQEIRIKTFEYDFAQITYSDFITTILAPWFNQRLTNLNYRIDLLDDSLNEIMGNMVTVFNLNITFNSDVKTKEQLNIKVKCKEKATQEAHNILNFVWEESVNLKRQNIQFENLPSQPNYSDVIRCFEAKWKSKFTNYQNVAFIFKGIKENKIKTTLLKKGNNEIGFTLAINNKSFFYLCIEYVY